MRNVRNILVRIPEGREYMGDTDVDNGIALNRILKK
jgi:hypothetical protein